MHLDEIHLTQKLGNIMRPGSILSARATSTDSDVPASPAWIAYQYEVMVDAPVLYLRCEEGGGATCYDASGNARDGAIVGTLSRLAPGAGFSRNLGGAVVLSGSANYISVPDNAALDITGAVTYECWVRPVSFAGDPFLISKGQDSGAVGGYGLWVQSSTPGRLRLSRANIGSFSVVSSSNIALNTWTHVVVTRDGSGVITYYINGVAAGTGTDATAVQATSQALAVGCNLAAGVVQEPLNGSIDEIAIYNTALSSGRVAAHYAAAPFTAL